jgi:hypothetical protein
MGTNIVSESEFVDAIDEFVALLERVGREDDGADRYRLWLQALVAELVEAIPEAAAELDEIMVERRRAARRG